MGAAERFREAVRQAVDKRSVAGVATDAGLPRDAIRYVLEGRDPKLSRASAIAEALDIEFCLGRGQGDSLASAPSWARSLHNDVAQLLAEIRSRDSRSKIE